MLLLLLAAMMSLLTANGETDDNVLWEGEADLTGSSWSAYCTIDVNKVKTLGAGDRVAVTVSNASKGASSWPSVNLYTSSTSLGIQYPFWTEVDNSAEFPITKENYLTQANIASIAENGYSLKLSGAGCKLTKVVRIPFDPVLWEGTSAEVSWNAAYTVPEALVEDMAVGDTLRVTVASATFVSGSKWPVLWIRTKVTNADDNTKTDIVEVQKTNLYANSAAVECPYVVDYVVTSDDLTKLQDKNSLYLTGANYTFSKVELIKYVEPAPTTKTLDIVTTLYEGTTALTNWSRNYEQPTSIINSLQEGDVLTVSVSEQGANSTYPQLRICWGTSESQYVSWACYNFGAPYDYTLELTAEQVAAIKAAGKLYLNGCNITVSRWTLTQQKTVSVERGGAATTIWSGSQVVDWSASPSTYGTVEASAFAGAEAGMKLRMNFSNMKLGAQGRIVRGEWGAFSDANTYEKLPTAWGDYFEFTLTETMADSLKISGMHVTGIGYTLTSVQLIDPMKEYVIRTTFDTNDIKAWEPADGTPNLTVTLTNYETEEVTTTVSASLMTDMFRDYKSYSQDVTLAAGETKTVDLSLTGLEPGFYRMAAKANDNMLCTYYIGYNPTAIVSPDDSQPDFTTFWGTWKERLAAIPVDAELTLLNEASTTDTRNIYEVKYKSVPETVGGEPVYIYGYYAEPKVEGTYPCIIHFHGTDKSGSLTMPSGTTDGWCEFRFSARGQTLDKAKNGSVKYRTDPEKESSVDFYAYRLGDNDEHYYRYVYLDTRRAVDFVYSQAKVNKNAVFAAGGSQGGCLTYVCAALSDGRIRAIAPSITGHADFVHTMEIVGWPTNVFNDWINAKVTDGTYADYAAGKAALLAHQSYFDTKNFAKWITCPVITNFSLQDNTDGPHLNIAPYNLLTNVPAEDKQYSINQFKGHAAADNWGTTYMAFFDNYIANSETTEVAISTAQYGTYYNSKAVLLPSGVKAATIDDAESSALTINWRYDGDDNLKNVIPAATAVLLKGSTGDYDFTLLPHNTDAAPAGNLLKGHDESGLTTGGDKYYKLTYGSAGGAHESVLGWYWGAANGAAFTIGAHKAWLALSSAQARSLSFFALADDDQTTAIGNVSSHPSATPAAVYTLQGQRVHLPHRSATTGDTRSAGLKKGLYIVDGKKIVIK